MSTWKPEGKFHILVSFNSAVVSSKNLQYLREHGPSTVKELPVGLRASQRADGIRRFKISGHGGGPGDTLGGPHELVYYLPEHDPETILRAYLEANHSNAENASRHGFTRRAVANGSEFREAAQTVGKEYLEPRDLSYLNGPEFKQECPACGDIIEGKLPHHLVECDAAAKL